MARFQFNLRHLLTPRATPPCVTQHALRDLMGLDAPAAAQGPGWFDSSFDLSHGLEVRDAGDAGYDDWLAARAIAEGRAAAKRANVAARHAATARPARRVDRAEATEPLDLADLAREVHPLTATPASRSADAPPDDFSRFGIEGLALA
ncbi:MAG: hypothetical protein V4844_21730 [Pseudomonadota bacterium]